MISSSSIARISNQFWLGGAHYLGDARLGNGRLGNGRLGGLLALACPAPLPMRSGSWHEQEADARRQEREVAVGGLKDFHSKADFYGKADFCSLAVFCNKALAGSGDM